nr:hydroxymethylglutaryl-CoA lyase [Corynebacterium hadale]
MKNFDQVKIRDVTLRDGLQLVGGVVKVEDKVNLIRTLFDLGVHEVEIGSMARPDLVPSMANTLDVVRTLSAEELTKCWVWVATPKHVQRAAEAGARNFQYCLSVSDSHNKKNIGRSTEASLEALPMAIEACRNVGGKIQLCLATSFTCPFEGQVKEDRVVKIVDDERTAGTCDVVVCDTLGQATPSSVKSLIRKVVTVAKGRRIVYHGHDTWGLGVANALAAIEAGASVLDGALGGLGGCPFAPGASGNTSTEDLVYAFTPGPLGREEFQGIVAAGQAFIESLGEANESRSAMAAFSSPKEYAWAVRRRGGVS